MSTRYVRIDWSPPAMEREGFYARDLEVLANSGPGGRLPDNIVIERVQKKLADRGLLRWHHRQRGVASLGDYYARTPAGDRVLARWRDAVRALGTPSTRRTR